MFKTIEADNPTLLNQFAEARRIDELTASWNGHKAKRGD